MYVLQKFSIIHNSKKPNKIGNYLTKERKKLNYYLDPLIVIHQLRKF